MKEQLVLVAGWVLVAGACGDVESAAPDAAEDDNASPDAMIAPDASPRRCRADAPFGAPTPVDGLATPKVIEANVRMSTDELTAYVWGVFDGASAWSIAAAERASVDDPFGELAVLGVDSEADDWDVSVSADGRTLVFGSTRLGGDDLFLATRSNESGVFGTPTRLDALSTKSRDGQPFLTADDEEIWFVSDRPGGDGGTDIYRATRFGNTFAEPQRVEELSSAVDDWMPMLSADRLTIYLSSRRAPSQGLDIWTSTRVSVDVAFPPPVLAAELNSSADENPGWLSSDGCRMYLGSTRSDADDVLVATRAPE